MTDSISFPYTVRRYRTAVAPHGAVWAVMHDGVAVAFYRTKELAIAAAARFTLMALYAGEIK